MAEYIEREAAIRIVEYMPPLKRQINEIPAADVKPVKHGRWVDEVYVWQGLKSAQCNKCKRKTNYYTQPKYCPNCGADMKEEAE